MHDPTHEYDENCEGCKPALLDLKTGRPMPATHPMMVKLLKVWPEITTLTERRAWHRVVVQNSKSQQDMEIAQGVAAKIQEAMQDDADQVHGSDE